MKKYISNPGCPTRPVYSAKVLDDGSIELVEVGIENVYEKIQSYEPSVNINNLVARFAAGDITALNQGDPFYGDVTKAPKTLAEALQMQINSERAFDSLPVDVKSKFDNDKNKFFVQAGTEEWYEKLGFEVKKPEVTEEVKE